MPRKGWSSIPVSDGWLQVLRGAKWPRASKPPPVRAKPGPATNQSHAKVRSLEALLAALGPDDSTTKAEVEAVLRHAKEGCVVTRVDPDTRVPAAGERVARLERAFAGWGISRVRGHQFEDSFEASTEGCTGIARGSPDPRAGGFHRKGTQENCQDGRRQVVRGAEFGRSREKVDRVEGSCTDTSAIPGRFRSPSVAKHGFATAGSSQQFEGSSWFGQARSKPQAGVPSGGFCAPLRRGDARVDGVTTEGLASGSFGWTSRGSGQDFQSLDQSSGRVAVARGGLPHIECSLARGRYGLRGVRIGEAAHPGPNSRRRRAQRLWPLPWSWDSDTESDEEGRQVVRRLEAQSINTDAQSSEVLRALEADLCSNPHASRRVVLVPQSLDGTPRLVHDVQEPDPSLNDSVIRGTTIQVEPIEQVPSTVRVREVHRHETILDSSDDKPLARRVSAVLSGSPGRTQRDSEVQVSSGNRRADNEIVSPSQAAEVQGLEQVSEFAESVPGIDRRTRRRLSLVWRANIPDSVPVQNQADVPDSHNQRLFRVRRAMQMERQEAHSQPEPLVPGPHPPCIRRGWEAMDTVNLQAKFRCRVRCLQGVPSFLRGQFRSALVVSLEAMRSVYNTGDHAQKCRSWKVFRLTSRMILWRKHQWGPTKVELERRMDLFHKQEWVLLSEEARQCATGLRRKPNQLTPEEELVCRGHQAEKLVHQGEVSRARQALCSQARAPGTAATLNELRDPVRRPAQLSEAIPVEVSRCWPHHQFELDQEKSASNLRSAPRGSAAGLAGDTNEHYKVMLDDEEATHLIIEAAEHLSQADLPSEVADALAMGAMTVKDNGGIRGIVAGDTFRRGVARTMAQQCALRFERACMPFSTRAGTDCVARVVRSLMEVDPRKTLLSIDGVGAFDHIKWKATNPDLAPVLPFVRLFYGKDSKYVWYEEEGLPHEMCQGEGGEQGDVCPGSAFSSPANQCYFA